MFAGASIIHRYTRAEALEDGVLVAADPGVVREAGFKYPVAFTAAAWDDAVAWTSVDTDGTGACQDQEGRLWDVLSMARFAVRSNPNLAEALAFNLYRVPRQVSGDPEPEQITLRLHFGPGDEGEPVLTVMQPHED